MSRHLSWEFLANRISSGVPSVEIIDGKPACEVRIDAGGAKLSLLVSVPAEPDEQLPSFTAIDCRRIADRVHLSCTNADHMRDFYAFVMAVADRVQLRHQPIVEAINDAAESVRALFAATNGLSAEQELGLWGELMTLRELAKQRSWKLALDSWIANANGPEEHDFSLPQVDLEVKTTSHEFRRHHISSESQLRPKPGRELFVLSYQLTVGGSGGASLLDQVVAARREVDPPCAAQLDRLLKANGWEDRDAARYRTAWLNRSDVLVINARELPRVGVTGENTHRVTAISYVVDVTALGSKVEGKWTWLNG